MNSLDKNISKNYRHVLNLACVSKVLEIIANRLTEHLARNNLMDVMLSTCRSLHSTETAFLKVQNDVLSALNESSAIVLLMLDLSAAFYTIDHQIRHLNDRHCIKDCVHAWFRSYLSYTQCVFCHCQIQRD